MVSTCVVYKCKVKAQKGSAFRLHRFPQVRKGSLNMVKSELKLRRRKAWYQALRRSDFTESELANKRICSLHFISGAPADDTDETNPDWIPSLHLGHRDSISPDTAKAKYAKWKRWHDRENKSSISLKQEKNYEPSLSPFDLLEMEMTQDNTETILVYEAPNIANSEPVYETNPNTPSKNNLFDAVSNDDGQKSTLKSILLPKSCLPITSILKEKLSDTMQCSSRTAELQNENEILLKVRNSFINDQRRFQEEKNALLKENKALLKEKNAIIQELEREKISILKQNNELLHKNFLLEEENAKLRENNNRDFWKKIKTKFNQSIQPVEVVPITGN